MAKWFVRTRGRIIGPFPESELKSMREARQLQAFDEVSRDQLAWEAIDLCPVFRQAVVVPPPPPIQPLANANPPSPEERVDRLRRRRVGMIYGGIVAVCLVLMTVSVLLIRSKGSKPDTAPISTSATDVAATIPHGVIKISSATSPTDRDKVLSSTVGLVVAGATYTRADGTQFDMPDSTGTGFVITADGNLITNMHVVDDVVKLRRSAERVEMELKYKVKIEPKLWVFFGHDEKFDAELIHRSENFDLAILKISRSCPWHFSLCDRAAKEIPTLDFVSSIGFPGIDRDVITEKEAAEKAIRDSSRGAIQSAFSEAAFEFSKRDGSLTKKAERKSFSSSQKDSFVLQHTAQIFGGNSGGPLITKTGLVIGINTWGRRNIVKDKTGKNSQDVGALNINFALTLPQLRSEIDKHAKGVSWQPLAE